MTLIRDILQRPVDQQIAEVIQVNEGNEDAVHEELTEYVVTKGISERYRHLLQAIAEAPSQPPEGVGVWISGFFGSGKSSFAKNLGYMLMNGEVKGTRAAELFKANFEDRRIHDLVDSINARIPTEAILFDVSKERNLITGDEPITQILYRVLLRHFDYAEDFDVAELEIELEGDGRLERFVDLSARLYGEQWSRTRKGAQKLSKASAVLHEMDAATFPTADSWAHSLANRRVSDSLSVTTVVARAFDLAERRRPGKALTFVLDEVGAYVAQSVPKLEDLRALVEQFGAESRVRLRAKRVPGPAWFIVTSQEKLEEVVNALDSRRVELARVQDRFRERIDLSPEDIREVATRRVLSKKPEAESELRALFAANEGRLSKECALEGSPRKTEFDEAAFIQFYPYLPHYIDLSIDIMSGLRVAHAGATRQMGGSQRTIIKQAHEMLINERTNFADREVGALVSLDQVYELVEGNFPTEQQKDISDIERNLGQRPGDGGWSARVAKVIALLSLVRNVPRTTENIAALLVDEVGGSAPAARVTEAIKGLLEGQYIRQTEEGYKLQTAQEKGWDAERRNLPEPRPKEQNDIKREVLGEVFADPRLGRYQFQGVKTFRIGLRVDDVPVGDQGQISVNVLVADDENELTPRQDDARNRSRPPETELFWTMAMTTELDGMVRDLFRSRQMVAKYTQRRAQEQITATQAELLSGEQGEEKRLHSRLRDNMTGALEAGGAVFQGVVHDGNDLGKALPEMLRQQLERAIPVLYPKLEMGARTVKGTEPEEVLKAANLSALSQVFYGGPQGLDLVRKDDDSGHFVPNQNAGTAAEVLQFLRREQTYGNKVTGKALETHFGGTGYGWEFDVVRVVVAVLLRAGAVEVTHQGRRYRGHQDPQSRLPFTSAPAFRNASFAPRESAPTLKDLTRAVEQYEQLTGEEVDVEEGAIAAALKKLAEDEGRLLVELAATVRANALSPAQPLITEYQATLAAIAQADTDDCVRILAGEGASLKQSRDRVRELRESLQPAGIESVQAARAALGEMWPVLRARLPSEAISGAARDLEGVLVSEDFFRKLREITAAATVIGTEYQALYTDLHARRSEAAIAALDAVKGMPDWLAVAPELHESLVAPLAARRCEDLQLPPGAVRCATCRASVGQLESDLDALPALQAAAIARVRAAAAPPDQRVERVRVASFFAGAVEDEGDVTAALDRLRDHLLKLLAEGARIVLE